ncbi:MAG: hypothetical protein RLZ25_1174 [Pseudomonadota bacterium]
MDWNSTSSNPAGRRNWRAELEVNGSLFTPCNAQIPRVNNYSKNANAIAVMDRQNGNVLTVLLLNINGDMTGLEPAKARSIPILRGCRHALSGTLDFAGHGRTPDSPPTLPLLNE